MEPGRREPKPDFVFGIDDLELVNRHQPEEVIRVFREALAAELRVRQEGMNRASYEKLEAAVKERCSFHLFVPMCEGYFFANEAALRAAGCTRPPNLVPDREMESFEAADEDYLTAADKSAPWAIDRQFRRLHPKRYLEFLCGNFGYRETKNGVAAMRAIDWTVVLARQQSPCFLRSLFQDLAYALETDLTRFSGSEHPLTASWAARHRMIRNL